MGLLFRSEHLYMGNYEDLQQSSGLKDKNGKLIYEGDILKYKFGKGFRTGVVTYDKTIWQVSSSNFVQGAWCGGALINMYDQAEIIGNIYENQELLGDK